MKSFKQYFGAQCCIICVVCSFLRIDEVEQIINMDIEKSSPTIDPCGTPCSNSGTVLKRLLIRTFCFHLVR